MYNLYTTECDTKNYTLLKITRHEMTFITEILINLCSLENTFKMNECNIEEFCNCT